MLEIPLDKEVTANYISHRNLYETQEADPGCEGIMWVDLVTAPFTLCSCLCILVYWYDMTTVVSQHL